MKEIQTNQRQKKVCPVCKGKGHTADGLACLILFALAPFEVNDPNGLTRDKCERCNGSGLVNDDC